MTTRTMAPARTRTLGWTISVAAIATPTVALITTMTGIRAADVEPGMVDIAFIAVLVLVTAAVFGLLVPWALRRDDVAGQAKLALGLAIVAWITGVVFWTMLPLLLGGAAAIVALANRDRAGRRASTTAALWLGTSAALITFVMYVASSVAG